MQLLQSGRGVIIAITIVFSCLSFTLGFFVGKLGKITRPEAPAVATEPAAPAQNGQPQQPQNPLPAEYLKTQPENAGTPVPPAQNPPRTAEPAVSPSASPREIPGPKPDTEPGQGPARTERDVVARQVKEVSKTTVSEHKQDRAREKQDSDGPLYTVQVGAFKNKAEADKFRAKYSKKGYKIYIEGIKTNRNMKIYKLRTGEFREKKDAEVLAVKLKKTENLKTFVVPVGK